MSLEIIFPNVQPIPKILAIHLPTQLLQHSEKWEGRNAASRTFLFLLLPLQTVMYPDNLSPVCHFLYIAKEFLNSSSPFRGFGAEGLNCVRFFLCLSCRLCWRSHHDAVLYVKGLSHLTALFLRRARIHE